jgi:hypothetical protein
MMLDSPHTFESDQTTRRAPDGDQADKEQEGDQDDDDDDAFYLFLQ